MTGRFNRILRNFAEHSRVNYADLFHLNVHFFLEICTSIISYLPVLQSRFIQKLNCLLNIV
jgi:hypothetical protein